MQKRPAITGSAKLVLFMSYFHACEAPSSLIIFVYIIAIFKKYLLHFGEFYINYFYKFLCVKNSVNIDTASSCGSYEFL